MSPAEGSVIPTPTRKAWKRNGFRPAGRSALALSEDEFTAKAKPLVGTGKSMDVAILRLAGEHGITTEGLGGVLIRAVCPPENRPASADPYQMVVAMRKREQGRRLFTRYSSLLSDDVPESQAPVDVGEDRADNVMTAAASVAFGQGDIEDGTDDVAQLLHNGASRVVGEEATPADDLDHAAARDALAGLAGIPDRTVMWLTTASLDDMTIAVQVAVKLHDTATSLPGGDRHSLGLKEKWYEVGKWAVIVGALGFDKMGALFDDLHRAALIGPTSNQLTTGMEP